MRRHPSERTFGVQLAGSKPATLGATAETIAREFGPQGVDFVDVNCGCPIDLVFRSGSGSARGLIFWKYEYVSSFNMIYSSGLSRKAQQDSYWDE